MSHYASSPRKISERTREIKEERLQEITDGMSRALRLSSLSAASFPGRNEYPGTHCSLIIQKEREKTVSARSAREIEVKGKMEKRTEGDSDRRRREVADLLVLPRPAKSVQNGAGFSRKTGTYWACRKGKSGLSVTERAVGKNAGTALAKRKRNRAICPKHHIMRWERVKVGESRTLAREGGLEREHEVERVDSTVKEGRFQGGKGGQARRASLEEVEGSMSG